MAIFKSVGFQQYRERMKSSWKLTTHKIALIGVFLALTTMISLLEIPTFFLGFLHLDFGNTVNLLAVYVIGWPYAVLIALICPWLRLIFPTTLGGSGNVVGALSYMLSTLTILIILFALFEVGNCFFKKTSSKTWQQTVVLIIVTIVAGIITSLLNTFFNYTFLLDLYGAAKYKSAIWTVFLPFNLFKFTFVLTLFLMLKKPFIVVKKSFHL